MKILLLAKHKVRSEKSSAESGEASAWLERVFLSPPSAGLEPHGSLTKSHFSKPVRRSKSHRSCSHETSHTLFSPSTQFPLPSFFSCRWVSCRAGGRGQWQNSHVWTCLLPCSTAAEGWQYNHPSPRRHILGDTKPITLIYGAFADIYTLLNWREENGATNTNLDCGKKVSAGGGVMEETDFKLTKVSVNLANASPFWHICWHSALSPTRYTIISRAVQVTAVRRFPEETATHLIVFGFACWGLTGAENI